MSRHTSPGAPEPTESPDRTPGFFGSWRLTAALTLLIAGLLAANSFHTLFQVPLYEHSDWAANALVIRRAKEFTEIYGQYSRWSFHHPGPAYFYVQAAGEWLLHDVLKLVPRPYNGQVLGLLLLNAAFIGAALATVARWLGPRSLFLPLALAMTAAHYGALGDSGLLSNWAPHFIVANFGCFLVACASLGSGRIASLPLALVSGCFLVHAHIAQLPLFVVPLLSLAYGGWIWSARAGGGWSQVRAAVAASRREHLIALSVAGLFALPLFIDLLARGGHNLGLILEHRRAQGQASPKGLASAFFYTFCYATYDFFRGQNADLILPQRWTGSELWNFVWAHRGILGLWLAGLGTSAAVIWTWRRQARSAAQRSILWLWAVSAAALLISFYWARIQDGPMFYFNAWFNFSIVLAFWLAMLAGLCWTTRNWRLGPWPFFLLPVVVFYLQAARLRMYEPAVNPASRRTTEAVAEALRADPAARSQGVFVAFPETFWDFAITAALELDRSGVDFWVKYSSRVMFGEMHAPADVLAAYRRRPFRVWRVVPDSIPVQGAQRLPLNPPYALLTSAAGLDPVAGAELPFAHPARFSSLYLLFGWSDLDAGSPYVWSEKPVALLHFRPDPVPAGSQVEMRLDVFPCLDPIRRPSQRLRLTFNETNLGEWNSAKDEPLQVKIPAAVWNAHPEAFLQFDFPDARSPASVGTSGDRRLLGFGFRKIEFRVSAQ